MTKRVRIADIDERYRELSSEEKEIARQEIGILLVNEINKSLDSSLSPVSGGSFKRKKADGKASELFESGDMRAAISYEEFRDGVEVGVFDSDQAPKAFNHNTGDTLPTRQFIPDQEQGFKERINNQVRKKISEIMRAGQS